MKLTSEHYKEVREKNIHMLANLKTLIANFETQTVDWSELKKYLQYIYGLLHENLVMTEIGIEKYDTATIEEKLEVLGILEKEIQDRRFEESTETKFKRIYREDNK